MEILRFWQALSRRASLGILADLRVENSDRIVQNVVPDSRVIRTRKTSRNKGFSEVLVSRGDRRLTFPNDLTGVGLFQLAIANSATFTAERFFAVGKA